MKLRIYISERFGIKKNTRLNQAVHLQKMLVQI